MIFDGRNDRKCPPYIQVLCGLIIKNHYTRQSGGLGVEYWEVGIGGNTLSNGLKQRNLNQMSLIARKSRCE